MYPADGPPPRTVIIKDTIHPEKNLLQQVRYVADFSSKFTADCDFHADVNEEEQSEEMHCFDRKDLPEMAFLTLSLLSSLLANLGETLCGMLGMVCYENRKRDFSNRLVSSRGRRHSEK
jgi:hypothetical protein